MRARAGRAPASISSPPPPGEGLAGNVGSLAPGILDNPGWTETAYRRIEDQDATEHHALARIIQLPGGFRLLVGRDLEERERLYDIVIAAGRWSLAIVVVLGLAGGFFVTRRVLKRVDAMTDTTQTIMHGDLAGRLPVAGTGDELDRLAENLNAMLERIEALMHGLKEVSDNIAHDLKTPLTRLRNRCEEALRTAEDESQYRAALETTIEESDALIRTFNALLMIARAESGPGARRHERVRRRRDRARRRRAVRAARRRQGHRAQGRGAGRGAHPRQPRAGQPGARQSGRQRHQICRSRPACRSTGRSRKSWSRRRARGTASCSRSPTAGPGIPEADRARVVERFVRLEQSRSQPGSGLGLSLASAVARLHGGELKLEDNHPGLKTVISLPRGGPALAAGSTV